MSSPVALVTGVSGQDGSYLADLLLADGYVVHGLVRTSSAEPPWRLAHLAQDVHDDDTRFVLHHGDLTDGPRLIALLTAIAPDEVYNLGSSSDVKLSFDEPEYTGLTAGLGPTRLLEAIRMIDLDCRYYQAASSSMFGPADEPQDESSPIRPSSPLGVAKAYAYWTTRQYRETYGMFAVNGIAFNHESPRRGQNFVTRKIAVAAAAIARGERDFLHLGNLDAARDWGFAPEYVHAMRASLRAERPDDYVLATGTSHTVREFLDFAFGTVGLDWERHVKLDPRYYRPQDEQRLVGDAGHAARTLGWRAGTLAPDLARIMVEAELARPDPSGRVTP